ncbi:MAG TPA: hypothetical protein VD865_12430 [Stenotrophomonas sp.]|nr:hypothetical protein [Stenotrophomonas sp.]
MIEADSRWSSGEVATAAGKRRAAKIWALLTGVALVALWLGFQPYQSHYQSALRLLGDTQSQSYFGVPKEGRGDEWSTYLPILKQAYLEGFPAVSPLAPYNEKLKWFIAIPHLDASVLFLPNHLAYWVMPSGMALSFQGFYYYLILLGSAFWLMRNMGVRAVIAACATVALSFSHLYQAWWTSNFAVLATCLLPFAVLTSDLRPIHKWPLLFWSFGSMLFGQMYPPFYFSLALTLGPFVLAVKPGLLSWRTLAWASLCAVAAMAAYLLVNLDYVTAVSNTIYPGHRSSSGGGSTLRMLMAAFFPTFPTHAPPEVPGALYEGAMAGTYFPLLLAAVLPFVRWDKTEIRVTCVVVLVGLVQAFYAVHGFPEWLAKYSGFFIMPGRRAHFGLSVLVLVYSAFMLSRNFDRVRAVPLLLCCAGFAGVGLWSGVSDDISSGFSGIARYPYFPLFFASIALLFSIYFGRRDQAARAMAHSILVGMAVVHVLVFGSFNPVIRASLIMDPVDSQLIRDWKALLQKNGGQPLSVIGSYGHLLRGENLPAFEAIHLANVDRGKYRELFPMLDDVALTTTFNHFRGIAFANIPVYQVSGLTAIFPVDWHGVAFTHSLSREPRGERNLLTGEPTVSVVQTPDGTVVYWQASLAHPLPINAPLELALPCVADESWLTRYPLGGGLVPEGVALQGVAGHFRLPGGGEREAAACAAAMALVSSSDVEVADEQALSSLPVGEVDGWSWSGRACDIALPPGVAALKMTNGKRQEFNGFVVGPDQRPAERLQLVLRGQKDFALPITRRTSRPDVAEYFKAPALENSGFAVSSTLAEVPAGEYRLFFGMAYDEKNFLCDSGKQLVLQAP